MKKKIIGAIALAILVTGCNPSTSSSEFVSENSSKVTSSSLEVTSTENSSSSTTSEVSTSSNSSTSTSISQETSSSSTNKDETGTVHSTGTGWLPPI